MCISGSCQCHQSQNSPIPTKWHQSRWPSSKGLIPATVASEPATKWAEENLTWGRNWNTRRLMMWPASLSPYWSRGEVEEEPQAQLVAKPQGQEREMVHSIVNFSVNLGDRIVTGRRWWKTKQAPQWTHTVPKQGSEPPCWQYGVLVWDIALCCRRGVRRAFGVFLGTAEGGHPTFSLPSRMLQSSLPPETRHACTPHTS